MKIKKGFVKCSVGEKFLVVTTGELSKTNNIMIELNSTSSDMWEMIEKGYTAEQIANAIAEKYDIPYDKAKADTDGLIANMKNTGIIEE